MYFRDGWWVEGSVDRRVMTVKGGALLGSRNEASPYR